MGRKRKLTDEQVLKIKEEIAANNWTLADAVKNNSVKNDITIATLSNSLNRLNNVVEKEIGQ